MKRHFGVLWSDCYSRTGDALGGRLMMYSVHEPILRFGLSNLLMLIDLETACVVAWSFMH
jgi:hypothetical protein